MAIRIYQGTGGGYSIYTINGKYIENSASGETVYKINGNYIEDFSSGKTIYKINGNYIEDFSSGRTVYKVNGKYIENFSSGKIVYYIDNPSVSSQNGINWGTGNNGVSIERPSRNKDSGCSATWLDVIFVVLFFAGILGAWIAPALSMKANGKFYWDEIAPCISAIISVIIVYKDKIATYKEGLIPTALLCSVLLTIIYVVGGVITGEIGLLGMIITRMVLEDVFAILILSIFLTIFTVPVPYTIGWLIKKRISK